MNLLRLIIIACVYMSISIFGALDSYATIINFNGKLDYIHFEEDASGQDIYPAGGRILAASSCSGIAGEWAGNWSETSCDTFDYSGSWTGTVSSDCVFTGTDNWDHVSGTIDPITLNVTASGISEDGCGAINVSGTFVGNSVSGSYSYSAGGGGLYSGTKIVGTISDNIIGAWSNGIWYLDVAASNWTRMSRSAPDGDIAAGDFTGDGKADVASIWSSGLWYQDGATLGWTKIGTAPNSVTTGDVTGDGRFEIIGTWSSGIWYYSVDTSNWTKMSDSTPNGGIAAGDFTGDGRADVASIWSSGLWYQNGATLAWTKVGTAPNKVTAGDVTGDGRFEIIGTWSSGIWYYNVVTSNWTRMSRSAPDGDIAAGDFTGDGRADVASTWSSGLWYQNGATLIWTKVSDLAPNSVTAGNITGN